MTRKEFNSLDDSLESFGLIKRLSEKKWKNAEIQSNVWGFQIQSGSVWNTGLLDSEIRDFESQIGVSFPDALKNFWRTMNGLDRLGINVGDGKSPPDFGRTEYSYPHDIARIKDFIAWTAEENGYTYAQLTSGKAPFIFPYSGNRFLIFEPFKQVLSMHGNDIIYWGLNLSKGLAADIFPGFMDTKESDLDKYHPIPGWHI